MNAKDFEALKDYILSKNQYFLSGYANAFKDGETDKVVIYDGNRFVYLMPNDTLGNYFYIRNEMEISHGFISKNSDCVGSVYKDTITAYLVAVVNNADPYALINYLRNTVLAYKGLSISPVRSSWQREQVVTSEMQGVEADDVLHALQRLKNETIVRLALQISKEFITSNCIVEPCKEC